MEEIETLPLFAGIPSEEIGWFLEHSQEVRLKTGEFFFKQNEPPDRFYVVLQGELQGTRLEDGHEVVLGTTPPGITAGEMELLTHAPHQATVRAIVPSRLRVLEAVPFRQMFPACPNLSARIAQRAIERTQFLTTFETQKEKMVALGKLSAGLAHELNNPSAAARRAAQTLRSSFPVLQEKSLRMNALDLTPALTTHILQFQNEILDQAAKASPVNPLEQSDREEELQTWFSTKRLEPSLDLVSTLVQAGIPPDRLEGFFARVPSENIGAVLSWLDESLCAVGMLEEIEESTRRISDLVAAIKEYTYVGQAELLDVDVHKGLESTLKMLAHKLKGITVIREYDPGVPVILAHGSELNQVWTNLIDNASDALAGRGEIRLITRRENDYVMVEIADSGPGIPQEALPHVFEPFYTTKEVGQGTGLGLDISYRIVRQHGGTMEVQSRPGLTRFIIRLPIRLHGSKDRKEKTR